MNEEQPQYLAGNVASWQAQADWYAGPAEKAWAGDPRWGVFSIPETSVGLLPDDLAGLRCIEIGCGAGYVSAWMARRGANVVGIDPTPNQLATARRLREKHGLDIEFAEGFGESLAFAGESFDFAISEYGAALWADPYRWIPEASRILKSGGRLHFLTNAAMAVLCMPDLESDGPVTDRLQRPYFGLHETHWPDAPGETEFHLTHAAWIDLFRANRFRVERLVELQVPAEATSSYAWADAAWASKWPIEEAWMLVKE